MATKPKTSTAKNKVPGYTAGYTAKTPQAAGRASKAASDQARARNRMQKQAETRVEQLRMSGMAAQGHEGTRGARTRTKKEQMEQNAAYVASKRRGKLGKK